ncbi:hypothetical protein RND81_09G011000 [Saponaria officinalis]|uniref:Peptide N-acetyl-beta-D-glucosaminyl asparaginase amidase A N-terminal domain-containing protein n=1 Tax=Saponaria officinalis TaxID=3572 RepID=A0AAW1IGU6_SAPOF
MNFFIFSLFFTSLTFLPKSTPLPHRFPPRATFDLYPRATNDHHNPPRKPPQPIEFFQVTRPIQHPPTTQCTHRILTHDFAYTYGREPVRVPYAPPSHCQTTEISTIILEWSATCQGRQFDRIFGVWLGGVDLLRSCTAEPTPGGIFWKVRKDISRYKSILMMNNQTLEIYLGNLIDKTYTGIYHVNLTIYYFPFKNFDQNNGNFAQNNQFIDQNNNKNGEFVDQNGNVAQNNEFVDQNNNKNGEFVVQNGNFAQNNEFIDQNDKKVGNFVKNGEYVDQNGGSSEMYRKWADKILPISRNLPLKDGLWFEIENSTDIESKEVVIPKNVYRAVLEVYVSFHENDEFWYTNFPNEYVSANNLTGIVEGNGPFREVLVSLDGDLVGAISPFTVVFTGGINPLLWRPITAIGSFDLPSYDIEITPFLGKLLDGKAHRVGFSVTNALNVWYVDANLHLWLDKKSSVTKGRLIENRVEKKSESRLNFKGLNGKFFTGASRLITSTGWVESSYGNITTSSVQSFTFENDMVLGKDGDLQTVNQTIEYNTSVSMSNVSPLYMIGFHRTFPLFLYTDEVDSGNHSYTYQSNVTLGFNEEKIVAVGTELSSTSLKNFQKADGDMWVKNNLVQGGLGSTRQIYEYDEGNCGNCYFRNVSSYNYTIVYDHERKSCKSGSRDYVARLDDPGILLRE